MQLDTPFYSPLYNTPDDEIEHCEIMMRTHQLEFLWPTAHWEPNIAGSASWLHVLNMTATGYLAFPILANAIHKAQSQIN